MRPRHMLAIWELNEHKIKWKKDEVGVGTPGWAGNPVKLKGLKKKKKSLIIFGERFRYSKDMKYLEGSPGKFIKFLFRVGWL